MCINIWINVLTTYDELDSNKPKMVAINKQNFRNRKVEQRE